MDVSSNGIDIATASITLIGVVISAGIASFVSWLTARSAINSEKLRRQSDLALQIANLISSKDEETKRAAMRRFAVGIVKVIKPESHPEAGRVYFIPMNSRVTVGRASDNDIVLNDAELSLSRWHCGFVASQDKVWIDDFRSSNGTCVNGEEICQSTLLGGQSHIKLGPFVLRYSSVYPNTILHQ